MSYVLNFEKPLAKTKIMNITKRLQNFVKYAETGDISYLKKEMERLKLEGKEPIKESKENVEPNTLSTSVLPKRTTRQKTATPADATFTSIPQIRIKQEKFSMISVDPKLPSSETNDTNQQPEQAGEMLAPTALPPKKKKIKEEPVEPVKRSTRTKTKKILEYSEICNGKPSDVMIQNTTVTMIDITEDKESDNEKRQTKKETASLTVEATTETRSTRTKTRQKKQAQEEKKPEELAVEAPQPKTRKNKRNNGEAEKKVGGKRSKSSSSSDKDENKSDYEDAVSNFDPSEQAPVMNATMVVEKPKVLKQIEDKHESENYRTPPPTKKGQIKEIFSPYDKTSLKKKVEAFEKLGSSSNILESASKIPIREDANTDPVKSKQYTPFTNKFMPKTTSTSLKMNRLVSCNSTSKDTSVSMKSLSALKASQAEYRELEKRRQEKEKEAQLKKEALLLAQAEEKRRKREEKQLKAQQQRDMIQKEREKQLEIQKLKEEKYKQAVAEKEEKLQKMKEEAEKKRLLAKHKAKVAKESQSAEEKTIENERNLDKGKTKRDQNDNKPIYMTTRPPLLPTDDCFDSDDEEYRNKKYIKPRWSRDDVLKRQLYVQLKAGEKIKNTLFCCQTHSPDLIDIFETIDPKKLKRTSSAIWKKPPRYTLFSTTSDIHFSEDSDCSLNV
ncbi:histone-lysine N-methyltransferase, H3 lysine-79 specific isoform X2 [Diabrotica virgifera virgifera]|uniref:Histone-lysine N-methyltransferase, H3 lysine-79 specific isoform X2 n=1 Tax=Diabrotica virgifera virgifera TaxID=50390 RepID=A0A6P7FYD9_DIAVI|nr:histone-lysine N-methyltransferase, H3 lysine-79 specific isoform X2 [Diabrotica virgifera virgifera]